MTFLNNLIDAMCEMKTWGSMERKPEGAMEDVSASKDRSARLGSPESRHGLREVLRSSDPPPLLGPYRRPMLRVLGDGGCPRFE